MKSWIFSLAGVTILVSAAIAREWILHQEIEANQISLKTELKKSIQSAESFGRLEQLRQSSLVYDRFLEPIMLSTQRMLWPLSRTQISLEWEKEVHKILDEETYAKTLELRSEIKNEIKSVETEIASFDRLKKGLDLILKLDSESLRLELLKKQVGQLEEFLADKDQALFKKVRELGKNSFKELKAKVSKMSDAQFRNFVSSSEFLNDIHQPIVGFMLEIDSVELRSKIWPEYLKTLKSVLSQKPKDLATRFKKNISITSDEDAKLSKSVRELAELLDANSDSASADSFPLN